MRLGELITSGDKLFRIIFLLACGVISLIVLITFKGRNSQGPRKPTTQIMFFAPGSVDMVAEVSFPTRWGSTSLFPLGKRKERKKTETFQKSAKD